MKAGSLHAFLCVALYLQAENYTWPFIHDERVDCGASNAPNLLVVPFSRPLIAFGA